MQDYTTYMQSSQGCAHLAKDNYQLATIMQGCLLQSCYNLEISIWAPLDLIRVESNFVTNFDNPC